MEKKKKQSAYAGLTSEMLLACVLPTDLIMDNVNGAGSILLSCRKRYACSDKMLQKGVLIKSKDKTRLNLERIQRNDEIHGHLSAA